MADEPKAALMGEFARAAKALSNPSRLTLLELLAQAERSVEELAEAAGFPVGNTSAQLQVLRNVGFTRARREGTRIYYRLAGDDVAELYTFLNHVARRRLGTVEQILGEYFAQDGPDIPMSREELLHRSKAGEVVIIDVRPAVEYASGHVPDAVSIPLEELPARLDSLPRDREIVVYCRGAYCLLAIEAARLLRRYNRCARILEDGMIEWRLTGLPVQVD